MAIRISEALGVSAEQLERFGAFDGFVDIDAQFHVDPHLLDASEVPELDGSHDRVLQHFGSVMKLLNAMQRRGDPMHRAATRMLEFREVSRISLGYSSGTTAGRGIGRILSERLADTAKAIVDAGIDDPEIFELVGLFEEGIGADRISDMTIRIILPDLFRFSERVAQELDLETQAVSLDDNKSFNLPVVRATKAPILLVPKDILRDLPVAHDWDDIDNVCAHNASVRRRVNRSIGNNWRYATTRVRKGDLKRTLLANPAALLDLLSQYKGKPREQYDFKRDPAGELIWHEIAQRFACANPFEAPVSDVQTHADLEAVVRKICDRFAELLELNGLSAMLYDDQGNLRNERFAQLLFYGIADAYCAANDFDLNREPNAGIGPVDFKISKGYTARVNVEIKYSSNSRLVSGYSVQLPAYNSAESATNSVMLIIRTTESANGIERVLELRRDTLNSGMRAPDVVVADGRRRPSASKRKRGGAV